MWRKHIGAVGFQEEPVNFLACETLAWGKQPDRSVGFWEKACCSSRFLERMCGLAAEEEGCVVVGVKLFIGAVT